MFVFKKPKPKIDSSQEMKFPEVNSFEYILIRLGRLILMEPTSPCVVSEANMAMGEASTEKRTLKLAWNVSSRPLFVLYFEASSNFNTFHPCLPCFFKCRKAEIGYPECEKT